MRNHVLICAVMLATSLCGCSGKGGPPPPPPLKNRQVDLAVASGPCAAGQSNCKEVEDSTNTAKYNCIYSGDDDGMGNVTISSAEGRDVKVVVHLKGAATFSMDNITFKNDQGQLTRELDANHKLGTIKDANTVLQQAEYAVNVSDTGQTPALTFVCDPRIVNN